MPTLHLADRPDDVRGRLESRHGIGAVASGVSHVAVLSLLILGLQLASDRPGPTTARQFNAHTLIWVPNQADGGSRASGGDRSTPARRSESRGADPATVPPAQTLSPDVTTESPTDLPPIPAVPMSHGAQPLPGAIESDATAIGLGAGDAGPGGDGAGRSPGIGNGPNATRGFGDGPNPGGPGVTTPVVIHQVKPQYTADAMRAKVQGAIWLECVVLPDGTVGEVRVKRSLDGHHGLDEQAIAAAKQWRFRPGTTNGKPVAVLVTIELTFTLR